MAILFDDATSEYIAVASTPITAAPLSMACWFNSNDLTTGRLMMINGASTIGSRNSFYISPNVLAGTGDPSSTDAASSTSGPTVNTWHHAAGVFASSTSRAAYIDGGSKGTNATSLVPDGLDKLTIGRNENTDAVHMSGMIAEPAIWNVALTNAEVALLALGFSPLFVRPESLVFYLPMIALGGGGTQLDWIGGRTMTETNTPATAAHPPNIIYPFQHMSFGGAFQQMFGSATLEGGMGAIPIGLYEVLTTQLTKTNFSTKALITD